MGGTAVLLARGWGLRHTECPASPSNTPAFRGGMKLLNPSGSMVSGLHEWTSYTWLLRTWLGQNEDGARGGAQGPRTICLSEKTERLWMSAMLWLVWQRSHTQGSAMRPRSISTRAVWAHTWHWKKASCISGISWDVLITMPLMAMSWSMSARRGERAARPGWAWASPSWRPAGAGLALLSSLGEPHWRNGGAGMAGVTGRRYGQSTNISLGTLSSGLGCPSCDQCAPSQPLKSTDPCRARPTRGCLGTTGPVKWLSQPTHS